LIELPNTSVGDEILKIDRQQTACSLQDIGHQIRGVVRKLLSIAWESSLLEENNTSFANDIECVRRWDRTLRWKSGKEACSVILFPL
jgi:hypothetical protein